MGKLVAWAPDRDAAIISMRAALEGFEIGGFTTSRGLLQKILDAPDFAGGTVTTHWLDGALCSLAGTIQEGAA